MTGAVAGSNPFRFSTKRTEGGTGLVLYEYRAYSPTLGRWLNRDHIGELGGLSLYGYLLNNPADYVDKLGMTCQSCSAVPVQAPDADAGGGGSGHLCKTGTLTFRVSQPKAISSEKDIKRKCNGAAACSYPLYSHSIKCEKCKACNWKLVVKIKADCKIFYADPTKVNVQFFPDLSAVIKHEQCHCEDWKAAFQQIIEEAGKAEYVSKSECEKAKKALDLDKRLDELIAPSINHDLEKYKRGGPCYAHSNW
jgi:RHS repeat-associated protein